MSKTAHAFRYLTPELALQDACELAYDAPHTAYEIAARVKLATFASAHPDHVHTFDAADALQAAILTNLNR